MGGGVAVVAFELLHLKVAEFGEDQLETIGTQGTVFVEVAASDGKNLLVDTEEEIHGSFVDVETGQMGQEIVSYKDVEKNEIIDDPFELVRERQG